MRDLDAIRRRWADTRWPQLGYFVHGQAKEDIFDLLMIVETYGQALMTITSQRDETLKDPRMTDPLWAKRVATAALNAKPFPPL